MALYTIARPFRLARIQWIALALSFLSLAIPILAIPSAASAVEVRYEASLLSHYVWRGIALTNDNVFQPSVRLAHANGLSFEAWANADLGDDNDTSGEINETRLTLDYRKKLGAVELGAGLTEYLFPNTPFQGSREFHVLARLDAVVSPQLEVYYDVGEIDGGYARLALAWEREFRPGNPRWRYGAEISAGYADAAFAIGRKAGLHDGNVELHVKRSGRAFDLVLIGGWTGTFDEEVLPEQPVELWTGLTVSFHL